MQSFILPTTNREMMAARVHNFLLTALPGNRLEVVVGRYVKKRTNPQCRWLNGVAYKALMDLTGYERDDISEWANGTFWGWKTIKCPKSPNNPEGCKDVPIRTTTTDENGKRCVMTTLQFQDFKEFIQRHGAKLGIHIADPNQDELTDWQE
jgi:hypothetical protein